MGRFEEACAAFAKATWNYAWQSAGHYALAQIHCIWREYGPALEHVDQSLETNLRHSNGRNLRIPPTRVNADPRAIIVPAAGPQLR